MTPLLALLALAGSAAPADLVDPLVGTLADFGQLTPAAVAPFGMVQLGPDTDPANHAGYDFAARRLLGFSHTRGVGVGCGGAGGDLLVSLDAPGAGPADMDKGSEQARAGFYHLRYGGGFVADLAATRGGGILRFTIPRDGPVVLRIDPRHSYAKRISARWLSHASDDLRADMAAGTVCDQGVYHLHSATGIRLNGRPLHAQLSGTEDGPLTLPIAARAGDRIEVRTGLSTVDAAGAAAVREAELGTRSLEQVAAATRAAWNRELGRVQVAGPREQRALFYTSLFRVFQTPVAIDDPDRRHRESDGSLATSPSGETRYASWSLWDNYRTQMPLLALTQPERSADIARSLVALFRHGKPRWSTRTEPFLTVRTEHAGIALLDFRRKGITGFFDAASALDGMAAESATLQRDTPDQQIEAAYDDWAVAELAHDLGRPAVEQRFRALAASYRPMWRQVFKTPGADGDVVKARGLYQGTIWQYRWAPVFDLPWIERTVGRDRLLGQLHHFFDAGLFNMTNEPDMQVPWLFSRWGEPQPTADLLHTILTRPIPHPYENSGKRAVPWVGPSFALAPQGFADGMDDDAGGMTGWYVFAALGLYPLVPGEPWYLVSAPELPRATLAIGGRRLTIERRGPAGGIVISVRFNGTEVQGRRIADARLRVGGRLVIVTRQRAPG